MNVKYEKNVSRRKRSRISYSNAHPSGAKDRVNPTIHEARFLVTVDTEFTTCDEWVEPPPMPELRQLPPVLGPRGGEAGVEQVPLPGTPERCTPSPPPVAATRFPDDVGTPKRDHFASSFRGLSASLSGRPY